MLDIVSFWKTGTFRVAEVEDRDSRDTAAFNRATPKGAELVKNALESGEISKPGYYRFVRGNNGVPVRIEETEPPTWM